ncbi:Eukaryotic translation initiation factor 4C [Durusdinium trenchii]|uniref:Eukaryotic translation initiation factor 4C n=1 Tax=Durusdinium trenchii TaxID=1381693 RepID=A0ABP0LP06_9DINO
MAFVVLFDAYCNWSDIDARAQEERPPEILQIGLVIPHLTFSLDHVEAFALLPGRSVLKDSMFILDLCVIVCGFLEMILDSVASDLAARVSILSILRLLRLGRVVRLVRLFGKIRALRELQKLVTMISTCLKAEFQPVVTEEKKNMKREGGQPVIAKTSLINDILPATEDEKVFLSYVGDATLEMADPRANLSKRYKAIPEEFEDKVVGFWELFSGYTRVGFEVSACEECKMSVGAGPTGPARTAQLLKQIEQCWTALVASLTNCGAMPVFYKRQAIFGGLRRITPYRACLVCLLPDISAEDVLRKLMRFVKSLTEYKTNGEKRQVMVLPAI